MPHRKCHQRYNDKDENPVGSRVGPRRRFLGVDRLGATAANCSQSFAVPLSALEGLSQAEIAEFRAREQSVIDGEDRIARMLRAMRPLGID
jgi:hypothetical protein